MQQELQHLAAALRNAAARANEAAARCNTLAELPVEVISDGHKDCLLHDLNRVEDGLLEVAHWLCRLDSTDYAKRSRWRKRAVERDKAAKGMKRSPHNMRGVA